MIVPLLLLADFARKPAWRLARYFSYYLQRPFRIALLPLRILTRAKEVILLAPSHH
jgi:hypothetical protein